MKKQITTFYRLTEAERRVLLPDGAAAAAADTVPQPSVSSAENGGERMRISPRAAGLAAAYGINPAEIVPSGPHGRVIERDILAAIAASGTPAETEPPESKPPQSVKLPESAKPPRPCYNTGETITFGSLRDRPLKWLVIESTPEKARIVCLECVGVMAYMMNEYRYGTRWEDSDIAKWLNGYFAYSAFLPAERARICEEPISILAEGEVRNHLRSADVFRWEKTWWVRPDRENGLFGDPGELPMTLVRPTDAAMPWKLGLRAGVRPVLWLRGEK